MRALYIATSTVAYLAVALVLGFLALVCWWMFALLVLQEFGCDGATGPCGSVGRFTSDYWWLINLIAAVLIALAMLPIYRYLLRTVNANRWREIGDISEIGHISDSSREPRPHHERSDNVRELRR